jgi:hypothetical protein
MIRNPFWRARRLVMAACGVLFWMCASARAAQEIASVPAPRSNVTAIALQKAERVTDENFAGQLRGQLQSALDTASKALPWQAQIVAPEVWAGRWRARTPERPSPRCRRPLTRRGTRSNSTNWANTTAPVSSSCSPKSPTRSSSACGLPATRATFLAWGQAAPKVNLGGDVLVEGTPPLTDAMVGKYADFLIWLFNKPELQNARDEMVKVTAVYLADIWKGQAAPAMAGTFTILHNMEKKGSLSQAEQNGRAAVAAARLAAGRLRRAGDGRARVHPEGLRDDRPDRG